MKRLSITLLVVLLTALLYFTVQAKDHIITDYEPPMSVDATQTPYPASPMITVTPGVYPPNPTFIPTRLPILITVQPPDYLATTQAAGFILPR